MTRLSMLTLAALLTSCAHVRIDDPALSTPAAELGESSARLMTETDETALLAHLEDVEAALVELSLAHDAWLVEATEIPDVEAPVPGDGISWDGAQLDATVWSDAGLLVAALRYYAGGTQNIDSAPGGQCIVSEPVSESNMVQCPPFIDQRLTLEREVDGATLRISADYGLALDGESRPVGGQVDVNYVLTEDGESRGGFVAATFHGLGRVQVFTVE